MWKSEIKKVYSSLFFFLLALHSQSVCFVCDSLLDLLLKCLQQHNFFYQNHNNNIISNSSTSTKRNKLEISWNSYCRNSIWIIAVLDKNLKFGLARDREREKKNKVLENKKKEVFMCVCVRKRNELCVRVKYQENIHTEQQDRNWRHQKLV